MILFRARSKGSALERGDAMARHAHLRSLAAAFVPLAALWSCGGTHDDRTLAPVPPASASASPPAAAAPAAEPSGSNGPVPVTVKPRPAAPHDMNSAVPPGTDPQKTVATVNGKPITADQVYSVYRMNKDALQQRGRMLSEQDDQALRAESLEVVMADELLYQAALAGGITAPPSEVEAAMKQFKQRVGSDDAYKNFLAQSGLTDNDVHREITRNIQTEAYRKTLTAGKDVSEDQAKKFYDENVSKGIFNVPEQVHVQYILVKANESDPEAVKIEARKRADEAAKRAVAGEDFGALAKEYSQDPTAARGGDIGLVPRGVMYPKFEEIAFAGKPGEVTPVFETPKGYNVMKILEKKPESTRSYDEVKSALMLDLGRLMEQDAVRAKIKALASASKIAILDATFARPAPPSPVASKGPAPAKP
jgi:parvulin-like peptidyl-prolyl isomerase